MFRPSEIKSLCDTFTGGTLGLRNRAMVSVLYRGGLRLNEALRLAVTDIDFSASTIHVRYGKGARGSGPKQRLVGVHPAALEDISRWLHARRARGVSDDAPLFCGLDGVPWTPQAVRKVLAKAGKKARLSKPVYPHALRHSSANHANKSGVPVSVIQKQLGHASLAVTSIYLDHLDTDELVDAMGSVNWDEDPPKKSSTPPTDQPADDEAAA